VPLGVATLHEKFADVADDSARFALMSWFFEEQIADFKPYLDVPASEGEGFQMIGTSGTVTTVGAAHLGLKRYDRRKVDGMHLSSQSIDEVIGRFLKLGPEGRRRDIGLGTRPVGTDHVGRRDPSDAVAGSGRPSRCGSPTGGCARACCSR
jgi:exopolyphosphatase / guanosine-5'-triphosphate,3'-diphosphate pyrophosphatase